MNFYIQCQNCKHVQKTNSYKFTSPVKCFGQNRRCHRCGKPIFISDNTWIRNLGVKA